ncbi:MAG: serine/threonine protein kinase [Anaerolineae bacterium]|nr:serine/threonine protein kinase [Gloeobacterales cyanobacterium ES-bin-313]
MTLKTLYFGQDLDWQQFEPFERELQILPKLDHPLIPKFLDTFWLKEPEGHYFCIVQQFIPGVSLAERLVRGDRFDRMQVEALAKDLLGVLDYLHSQDPPLVHRDIKPSNLIWGDDQKIHLIDFGAVQVMGQEERTLTATGTFGYMAPEQFVGRATPASDLYSLGATLIQLLTGQSLMDLSGGANNLHLPQHSTLNGWLGYWLERMVEPDLKYRFSSASQALATFERKQEGIVVSRETPPSSIQRFIVEECNDERLRVTLSLRNTPPYMYRTKANALGIFVASAFGSLFWFNHFGPLIAALSAMPTIILAVFSCLIILPQGKKQVKIGDGYCQINKKTFPLQPQTRLIIIEHETETNPKQIPAKILQLKDGNTGKFEQFKVRLKEEELSWLLGQFQMRRERANPVTEI